MQSHQPQKTTDSVRFSTPYRAVTEAHATDRRGLVVVVVLVVVFVCVLVCVRVRVRVRETAAPVVSIYMT